MPSDYNNQSDAAADWKENIDKIDELTKRLVTALNAKKKTRTELAGPDQEIFAQAATAYFSQMISDPAKMFAQQAEQFKKSMEYWSELQSESAQKNGENTKPSISSDKRFAGELWQDNPFFDMIRQQYLVSSRAIEENVANLEGLDSNKQKQIAFFAKQIVDMYAPTNFLGTNPEALSKAHETRGLSLVHGLENMVRDLEKSDGDLSVTLSDTDAFEVGVNIANTPGSVVFENRMFQLLQYSPTTEKAHEIPLLITPPWINKFYILDLKEKNSFIKFAVDQGFTVFVISWVNPGSEYRDVGFDTYLESGLLEAVSVVKEITNQPRINMIGYCIGGTLLTTGLAYLGKKGDKSIKSATFFTTLVDFQDSGELSVFIDESFLQGIEAEVDEAGYLDSNFMSRAFSFLRSNDLVYGPAVKSYLMGEAPPAFDLLYWNGDSTNLPARMAKEYLRKLYQANELSNGEFEILGETLDLGDIRVPLFAIATKTDHIAPWRSSFLGLNKSRGQKKFVLAGSGHIAGIINPAGSVKYGYWTNDEKPVDMDEWYDKATQHEGSWWADWADWLGKKSGKLIDARTPGTEEKYPVIEPAPGSYVK